MYMGQNRLSRQYKLLYSGMLGLAGLMLLAATVLAPVANALSIETPQDCDTNAVLYCGGTTTTIIHSKYNKSPDAQAIYNYFGISDWNMANLTKNAQVGAVTKDGNVLVGDTVVATGAITAGRVNMAGSTTVTSGGVTFYTRPPSASFQQASLPAFVVLNSNGEFKHAIIASCGNPVMATPKTKPTPKPPKESAPAPTPQPTPPTPTPTPTSPTTSSSSSSASSSSTSTAVVNINQQQQQTQAAPAAAAVQQQPAQVQSVATAPAATELPKTGPGQVLTITALSTIAGTLVHMLYTRRKARQF